jgi:opacity protein-like surface antigen
MRAAAICVLIAFACAPSAVHAQSSTITAGAAVRWDGWSSSAHGSLVLRSNSDLYSGLREFPAYADFGTFSRGSLSAGYAWQSNSFVLAPELRLGYGADHQGATSLVGRLGYTFGPSLLYGLAGYQETRATLVEERGGERVTARHSGLVVGAGIDTKLSERLFVRLEATYFDAGAQTYQFNGYLVRGRPSFFVGSPPQDSAFRDMNMTLGVGWHFN